MRNSEFQNAYLKIIAEENFKRHSVKKSTKKHAKKRVLFEDTTDSKSTVTQQQAKQILSSNTDAKNQFAAKVAADMPAPEPSIFETLLGGIKSTVNYVTSNVTKIIQQVPFVGEGVSQLIKTVDPTSPDFLNISKIPNAFIDGVSSSVNDFNTFLASDAGKKFSAEYKVTTDEQKKALLARAAEAQALKRAIDKANAEKLEKQIQEKFASDKSARTASKNTRELCSDIYAAANNGELKDGEYIIHLED